MRDMANRIKLIGLTGALLLVGLAPAAPVAPMVLEPAINRAGQDYRSFNLAEPDPILCRDTCAREGRCRAFTAGWI